MSNIKAQSVTLEGVMSVTEYTLIGEISPEGALEAKISMDIVRVPVLPEGYGQVTYTQDKTLLIV